jgi:hypothetical protein
MQLPSREHTWPDSQRKKKKRQSNSTLRKKA